jgi:hypothetical protein
LSVDASQLVVGNSWYLGQLDPGGFAMGGLSTPTGSTVQIFAAAARAGRSGNTIKTSEIAIANMFKFLRRNRTLSTPLPTLRFRLSIKFTLAPANNMRTHQIISQ